MTRHTHIALWVGVAIFVSDQLSKWLIVHVMDLKTLGSIDVLPPYVNFRMAWNQGINFGLFSNPGEWMRWTLIVLSIVISAWVVWWVRRENEGVWTMISAGLLVGGALGNVIDRVDFLNMSCCGFENPYSFNVADISIFAGAIGLILFSGNPRDADQKED